MGYERFIFWFWESQQQVDMHAKSKNTFIVLYAFILPYLLNDSQTIHSTIHFSKLLLCVTLICCDWLISIKAVLWAFKTLQKQHLVAKNEFAFSFRPTQKIKFSQVCSCNKWAANMLMFHVDVNMKRPWDSF